MFDRLQIFHQKKKYYLVQFLKVAKKMEKRLPRLIFFGHELSSNMPWRMARCITTRVSSKRNESRLSTPP